MHKVIEKFADLQDNSYVYNIGDQFPREGTIVGAARIAELSGSDNKLGKPLIVAVDEPGKSPEEAEKKARKTKKK